MIPGIVGIALLGHLVGKTTPGSQYIIWVIVPLFVLFFVRRYPKEEIFAFFGLTFGWGKIILFIITNILALFVLYFVLENLGAEPAIRKLLGE